MKKEAHYFRRSFRYLAFVCCLLLISGSLSYLAGQKQNPVFVYAAEDGVEGFVNRLYELVLGRPADSGSQTWVDVLNNGSYSGAQVAEGFVLGPEFSGKQVSNEEFVRIMYSTFLDRPADEDGLATWTGYMEQGYSKRFILSGFVGSGEFQSICDGYGIIRGDITVTEADFPPEPAVNQFVKLLYSEILGRPADSDGLNTWTTLLLDGGHTGAQVAEGFVMGPEFMNKQMSNEEFVQIMYRTFLTRPADEGGLALWTDYLEQGYSKRFVFAGFVGSAEFQGMCDGYGIIRGDVTLTDADFPIVVPDEQPKVSEFVERLYSEILGRPADADGLNAWVTALESGSHTGAQVAESFILSKEFQDKDITNEEYVQIMYRTLFGRDADPAGLATWKFALEDGYSKRYVFAGFANSTEFGALCEKYGILQGQVIVAPEDPSPAPSVPDTPIAETPASCFEWDENPDGTIDIMYLKDENLTEISIPAKINGKTVTRIWNRAFEKNYNLTRVELPASITSIGYSAFYDCESLISINIPEGVTDIGYGAFEGCSSLTYIDIPDTVTNLGHSVFYGCSSLTGISLPKGLTSIPYQTFYYCKKLTNIEIPKGVTSIGGSAFSGCSRLQAIQLPNEVTIIGSYAFSYCSRLLSINIPEGVTELGNSAFSHCSNLISIVLPDGLTNIDDWMFSGCSNLRSVVLPVNLTSMDSCVFSDCSSLTSIRIPESVISIGGAAFSGCTNLTDIKLPNNLTSISQTMFQNCSSLTGIEIPSEVTSIGNNAFSGCSSLTAIEIPEGVTSIESFTFNECSSLTNIKLPNSLTSIGNSAFYECSSLTEVGIPESVTTIGREAFYRCAGLKRIVIPKSVTSIGSYVFNGCHDLTIYCEQGSAAETYAKDKLIPYINY